MVKVDVSAPPALEQIRGITLEGRTDSPPAASLRVQARCCHCGRPVCIGIPVAPAEFPRTAAEALELVAERLDRGPVEGGRCLDRRRPPLDHPDGGRRGD